jgi:uncharacterized protein YfbU (UPF0304 family)
MQLTKENIAGYLLTLQLVEAGYHITYDEIREMYEAKTFLNGWKYYQEYTMTVKQNMAWFRKASKILKDTFDWHPRECDKHASMIDLAMGLRIKK